MISLIAKLNGNSSVLNIQHFSEWAEPEETIHCNLEDSFKRPFVLSR